MNLCAVGVSLVAPFLGFDTPVTVIQMLWINIIMDTLAGLAFAGEPALPEYMEEAPVRRGEPVLNGRWRRASSLRGFIRWGFAALPESARVPETIPLGGKPVYFYTAFFALFVFRGFSTHSTRGRNG